MKLAVFGTREISKSARAIVECRGEHSVDAYINDSSFEKIGGCFDGLPIISVYTAGRRYQGGGGGELDGILIPSGYSRAGTGQMLSSCKRVGFDDAHIFMMNSTVLRTGNPDRDGLFVPHREFVQIFDLNVHLVDHCNLNCELCCHSSQFVEEEVFTDPAVFERDLTRLHELVPNIHYLTLLGGEPLLHPELASFLPISRRIFPYTEIRLVTNGILLMRLSRELLDTIRENEIVVQLSLYPPMHEKVDEFLNFLRSNALRFEIKKIDHFFKRFTDKARFDGKRASELCAGNCMGLKDGRLSRCPPSLFVGYMNRALGTELPEEQFIDIYDPTLTPGEVMRRLEEPMGLCDYCTAQNEGNYSWRQYSGNTTRADVLLLPE